MKSRHASLIALAALAMLLSACEKPATETRSATVATVAGDTISEAELELAVSRLGDLNEAQTAEAKSRVLQALIDQRLVAEAARKAGLDKEPAVRIAVAQAGRQVLAEAYAERHFKDVAQPAENDIAEYYNQHPELFSQRRIYRVQELELLVEPGRVAEIEAQLTNSRSMGDFVNWVKEQGIDGKSAVTVKPSEQIPSALLARLNQMKDGQVTVFSTRPGQLLIEQLLESQMQPVSLQQAHDAIERALVVQTRKELLEADMKALREAARIEYSDVYAPAAANQADDEKPDSGETDEKPAN